MTASASLHTQSNTPMASHKLAVIIRSYSNDDDVFLLVRQPRPPRFDQEEYDSYVDSDLWDLPSAPLASFEGGSESLFLIKGSDLCSDKLELGRFDLCSALSQVLRAMGFETLDVGIWAFRKYVKEANFGPGPPIHTVFIEGKLETDTRLPEACKWISLEKCSKWLVEVKPSHERLGPLVVAGLLKLQPANWKMPPSSNYQEYPPGVIVMPMRSTTAKPFRCTNMVVIAPKDTPSAGDQINNYFAACGDALVVDPGCHSRFSAQLVEIITALPRKLLIFITHHHRDHVDGLSIIQKCNPDAVLLAHENTMRRLRKGDWSRGYTSISGGEELCVGGQRLRVISAPGHTDGHMALLHVSTNSLVVGDHCVGQGSVYLDIFSGGNMAEYFNTTYKFLDLSPNALIPMHGRVNLWPNNLLCRYLKNRRMREASVLKSIEDGARTLFEVVTTTYRDLDPIFWYHAGSNVRVYVEHLAHQDKLPKEFSLKKFQGSCMLDFIFRWIFAFLKHLLHLKDRKQMAKLLVPLVFFGFAVLYSLNR